MGDTQQAQTPKKENTIHISPTVIQIHRLNNMSETIQNFRDSLEYGINYGKTKYQ